MRAAFPAIVEQLMERDPRIVVLLGDIGVHSFRQVFARFPSRIWNMGICEQAMVGAAAGMAKTGLIPIVHTIAPFLCGRAYEQLKVDFGYQKLPGYFVTVGASHDYAALGCTHHAPEDVALMKSIPGMGVFVPGHQSELERMLGAYGQHPTYIRLSEARNAAYAKCGDVLRRGALATVLAVGPALSAVMEATDSLDVSVVYLNRVRPFVGHSLAMLASSDKILLVEPYFRGGLVSEIVECMGARRPIIHAVGIQHRFQGEYGSREEHEFNCCLRAPEIRHGLEYLINWEGPLQ
jgi:transketolase